MGGSDPSAVRSVLQDAVKPEKPLRKERLSGCGIRPV